MNKARLRQQTLKVFVMSHYCWLKTFMSVCLEAKQLFTIVEEFLLGNTTPKSHDSGPLAIP